MNKNKDIKIGDLGISKNFGSNKEYSKTLNKAVVKNILLQK